VAGFKVQRINLVSGNSATPHWLVGSPKYYIISLRVDMSLFVARPEIEGRNAVEADNWARHKKTFYSE
jgi:hypothetical protein